MPSRSTWPDEVRDLTPWVIKNLDVLASHLEMKLEFVQREARVSGFRADILARETLGRRVVIENQFGPTDHAHLGQIVSYACEASADVVVWLAAGGAPPVRPEHERTLMQLNKRFAGSTAFFAIELEVCSELRSIVEPEGPIEPRFCVAVRP